MPGPAHARKDAKERWEEYLEEVKPWLDMKIRLVCTLVPKITIYPEGGAEPEYELTEEQDALLRNINESIEMIQAKYAEKGDNPCPPSDM